MNEANIATKKLIKILERRYKPLPQELEALIDYAVKNKVLLHYLRVIGNWNRLRSFEEDRHKYLVRKVLEINKVLRHEDINKMAFFKLVKPVFYNPSDIDILIDDKQIYKAVKALRKLDFKIIVSEPYTVTLNDGFINIDLYVHPNIGGIIYIDGRKLLEYTTYIDYIDNHYIPILEKDIEALVTITHAIYKERVYTLNDYITVKTWLTKKAIKIADELKCFDAVEEAINIHKLVNSHQVSLPYMVPLPRWLELIGIKIVVDKLTRATTPKIAKTFIDRRFGKLLISKLTKV